MSAFGQRDGKMSERIKTQKIAFITEKLDLSVDEAAKFWPVYNEFEAKKSKIRSKDLRSIKMQMRQNPDMSEKEADELLDKLMKAENDMHTAKLKLIKDLKKILPSDKIIKLRAAEDEFNKKLLEKLKEYREKRRDKHK
jgi:hypothetical protein